MVTLLIVDDAHFSFGLTMYAYTCGYNGNKNNATLTYNVNTHIAACTYSLGFILSYVLGNGRNATVKAATTMIALPGNSAQTTSAAATRFQNRNVYKIIYVQKK